MLIHAIIIVSLVSIHVKKKLFVIRKRKMNFMSIMIIKFKCFMCQINCPICHLGFVCHMFVTPGLEGSPGKC